MIDPSPHVPEESHGAWLERQRLLRRFEQAWRQGRPALDDFLPADPAGRGPLLVELVHTDLEYRIKAGTPARVEEYLTRYPELADPATLLDLVLTEMELRRRAEPHLMLDEYRRRFPQLAKELEARWPTEHTAETPGPVVLTCPDCRNLIEGSTDPLRKPQRCPWCGTVVHLRPADPALGAPPAPARLGKYQLQEVVGRGTFGIVYRAHDTELDRTVAVKVPRLGTLATPEDEERFLREARSAAQLRHPHIVTVHDAGKIDATCYLAAEFVPGTTLAARLRTGRLGFPQAAELLAGVAEALHYAHGQGVIHRDLKPSNVLLDAAGAPHLFDFGLAKRETGDISLTLDGQVLGTPAYMSPEQARGETTRLDARSDVYSLGVMLYELLTGELPFRGSVRMVLKQVQEEEPRTPRRLNDRIPRDLETICLKAMAKEPPKRYPTAGELAADLRRWLGGEPIHARPAGRLERLGRWCRRNPRVAVLSGLVLGLLVLLAVGSTVAAVWIAGARDLAERERLAALEAARRAEESAAVARTAQEKAAANARTAAEHFTLALDSLKLLVGEVQQQLLAKPGTLKVGQKVAETAVKGLEKIARGAADRPVADRAMVTAHQRLGDIFQQLGRNTEARRQYERARGLAKELLEADAGDVALKGELADVDDKLGFLTWMEGDAATAEGLYREAIQSREQWVQSRPGDEDVERALSVSYNKLGEIYQFRPDPGNARANYEKALALRQAHAGTTRNRNLLLNDLRFGYGRLADVCQMVGDFETAEVYCEQALETTQTWAAAEPDNPRCRRLVAACRERLGVFYLNTGRFADAEDCFRQAVDVKERLVAADPDNMVERGLLSYGHQLLGDARMAQGQLEAARASYERARALGEQVAARDVAGGNLLYIWLPCQRLAAVDERQDRFGQAAAWMEENLAHCRRAELSAKVPYAPLQAQRRRWGADLAVYAAAAALWEGRRDLLLMHGPLIARQPRVVAGGLLRLLAYRLLRQGRPQDAAAAAEHLRALGPRDAETLGVVARIYARCAAALPDTADLRERYRDAGVQALLATLRLPLPEFLPDFLPPDLQALRTHPGFQKFLRECYVARREQAR